MDQKQFDEAGLPEGMRPAYGLGPPRMSRDAPTGACGDTSTSQEAGAEAEAQERVLTMCRAAGREDMDPATRRARMALADKLQEQALAAAGTDRAPALWARVTATRPRPFDTPAPGMGFFAGDPLRDAGMRGVMDIGGDF